MNSRSHLYSIANRFRNLRFFAVEAVETPPGNEPESARMKRFHEQLKLERVPRISPSVRFVDLVLVETNPTNGELIPNSEKEPTKYGDWQHNGRVTDF